MGLSNSNNRWCKPDKREPRSFACRQSTRQVKHYHGQTSPEVKRGSSSRGRFYSPPVNRAHQWKRGWLPPLTGSSSSEQRVSGAHVIQPTHRVGEICRLERKGWFLAPPLLHNSGSHPSHHLLRKRNPRDTIYSKDNANGAPRIVRCRNSDDFQVHATI